MTDRKLVHILMATCLLLCCASLTACSWSPKTQNQTILVDTFDYGHGIRKDPSLESARKDNGVHETVQESVESLLGPQVKIMNFSPKVNSEGLLLCSTPGLSHLDYWLVRVHYSVEGVVAAVTTEAEYNGSKPLPESSMLDGTTFSGKEWSTELFFNPDEDPLKTKPTWYEMATPSS